MFSQNKLHKVSPQLQHALITCGYELERESKENLFFRKGDKLITFGNDNQMSYDHVEGSNMTPIFTCQFHYTPSADTIAMILLDCGALTYDDMKLLRLPKQTDMFERMAAITSPLNSFIPDFPPVNTYPSKNAA